MSIFLFQMLDIAVPEHDRGTHPGSLHFYNLPLNGVFHQRNKVSKELKLKISISACIYFFLHCHLSLLFLLQPPQFKLDPRLARLLGIHTQTRSAIIQALWQYIKTNKLQDSHDKEYINCDKYFQQVTPIWTQLFRGNL